MSETTYSIENAKSGRAACKKCKEKIGKGEIRLGVSAPGPGDYNMQSWYHPKCYTLPRKLVKAGIDASTFVADMLEDKTDEEILNDKADEIISAIETKAPAKKKDEGAGTGASKSIKRVKEDLEKIRTETIKDEDDEGPKKKKAKGMTEDDRARAEVLAIYEGLRNDGLKDVLRWNKQMVGGNKDALLSRIIDGHLNGRLGRCPTCKKGRVKLSEDDGGAIAYCNGFFDEENQFRVTCSFTCKVNDAPRLHPWYSKEPTEEEMEEIEAQEEAAESGGALSAQQSEEVKEDTEVMVKLVKGIEWDFSSGSGLKQAAKDMLGVCKSHLALPDDKKKARMEIGKIILANKNLPATEILTEVINQFGFAKVKDEVKKKEHEAHQSLCSNPANVSIMEAFMEMAQLSFKSGDAIRGAAYSKVVEAIKGVEYAIDEDNAKGLGKGKTKVANIGKGSAEKIYEFCSTGSIEKLEELRAGSL